MITSTTKAIAKGTHAAQALLKRSLSSRARIHEVGLRDGLQNEKTFVPTHTKLKALEAIVKAQPNSVEIASFVRADRVPALADADALCDALWHQPWALEARDKGTRFAGLVLNQKGFERFARARLDTVCVAVSATEAFSQANAGMTFEKALASTVDLIRTGRDEGYTVRGYISMAFGCPFEGATDPKRVLACVSAMANAGCDVILPSDTIGVARPEQVVSLVGGSLNVVEPRRLGLHMHDTHGRAAENCAVGVELGLRDFDASVGGLGGCPFAPGAAGNLATSDLLARLEALGIEHGVRHDELNRAQELLERAVGRALKPPVSRFEQAVRSPTAAVDHAGVREAC